MRSWLIDKSALVRLGSSSDAQLWSDRITRGLVRVTSITLLEIGFSARNEGDWNRLIRDVPVAYMPVEMMTPAAERRAVEVQRLLSLSGRHRAPSIPDLMIAAVAEQAGLTVLHLDKDFELIADVTRQELQRLE
ncbi:MAG: PIN domain nuclease [Tessaracoccus sp.]